MGCPLKWLKDAFGWITKTLKKIVNAIIDAIKSIVTTLFEWIKNLGEWVVETITDVALFVKDFVTFDLKGVWEQFKATLYDVCDLLNFTLQDIFDILDTATFGVLHKVWDVVSKVISVVLIVIAAVSGNVELAIVMITIMLLTTTGALRDPLLLMVVAVAEYLTLQYTEVVKGLDRFVDAVEDELRDEYFVQVTLGEMSRATTWGSLHDIAYEWIDKIGDILDMTKEEVLSLFETIGSGVKGTVGPVIDTLTSAMSWVYNTVKPIWDKVKEGAIRAYEFIGSNIGDVMGKIRNWWGDSFSTIADALSGVADWIYYRGDKLWDFIQDNVSSIWPTVKNSAIRAWDWIETNIADIWDDMKGSINRVWEWAKDITVDIWTNVKNAALNAWDWINQNLIPNWSTVKQAALDAWNKIQEVIDPFIKWIKENVWPTIQSIGKTLTDVTDWINQKGTKVYEWYVENIKPYLDKVRDLIHKAAIISMVVDSIKNGDVGSAILEGIGILGGKVEEFTNNILRFYDGTLTGLGKGIGYAIGSVRKMITDAYETTHQIAKDVAKIGLNVSWSTLNNIGRQLEDIVKITLGKARLTLGEVDRTVAGWLGYIKRPVTRALEIIHATHEDFYKYSHEYGAAFLRQQRTSSGRSFTALHFPRIVHEVIE